MDYCIETKKSLFKIASSLPKNGLATGSTGNISAIDPETGYVVIKSSSIPYEEMVWDDFVVLNTDGTVISSKPGQKPSFETPTHLEIYKKFPDVKSVLHTHINQAIVLAAILDEIECNMTPTGRRLLLNPVPVIPFVENGTLDMAEKVTAALNDNVAMVIRNHGAFTVGSSIREAFDRTIALRDVSELYYQMALIGRPSVIPR